MKRRRPGEVVQVVRHSPTIYISVTIASICFGAANYRKPYPAFLAAVVMGLLGTLLFWLRWFLTRVEISRSRIRYLDGKSHSLYLDEVRRIESSIAESGRSQIVFFAKGEDSPAFSIPRSFFGSRLDALLVYFSENYPGVDIVGFAPIRDNSTLFGQGVILSMAGIFLMATAPLVFPRPVLLNLRWLILTLIVSGFVRFAQTMRGPGAADVEFATMMEEIPGESAAQPPNKG